MREQDYWMSRFWCRNFDDTQSQNGLMMRPREGAGCTVHLSLRMELPYIGKSLPDRQAYSCISSEVTTS